jgi:hypothetical protein
VHHERSAVSCIQARQHRWPLLIFLQSLSLDVLQQSGRTGPISRHDHSEIKDGVFCTLVALTDRLRIEEGVNCSQTDQSVIVPSSLVVD